MLEAILGGVSGLAAGIESYLIGPASTLAQKTYIAGGNLISEGSYQSVSKLVEEPETYSDIPYYVIMGLAALLVTVTLLAVRDMRKGAYSQRRQNPKKHVVRQMTDEERIRLSIDSLDDTLAQSESSLTESLTDKDFIKTYIYPWEGSAWEAAIRIAKREGIENDFYNAILKYREEIPFEKGPLHELMNPLEEASYVEDPKFRVAIFGQDIEDKLQNAKQSTGTFRKVLNYFQTKLSTT